MFIVHGKQCMFSKKSETIESKPAWDFSSLFSAWKGTSAARDDCCTSKSLAELVLLSVLEYLTTLKRHKLFSYNADLPVLLHFENTICFRKSWMFLSVTAAETMSLTSKYIHPDFLAFAHLQHDHRSSHCCVSLILHYMVFFWLAHFLLWTISNLMQNLKSHVPDA